MRDINSTDSNHNFGCVFFIAHATAWVFLLTTAGHKMQMTLIKNPDSNLSSNMAMAYKIARVVYAQTGATSLHLVCAFTSMIKNISDASGVSISNLLCDKNIFPVLDKSDSNHARLQVPANSRAFQMCVRTAQRMLNGLLPDSCYGATKFHFADTIPLWATCRGYIADIDGVLFYV